MPAARCLDDVSNLAKQLDLVVEHFELDGQWHRVPVANKKKSNLSGAYCLSELSLKSGRVAIVGMLFNWVTHTEERLILDGVEGATPDEIAEAKQRAKAAAETARKEKTRLHHETAKRAVDIWNKLPDSGRSSYLDKKGVKAWGIRFSRGSIVVPACDAKGQLWTLQFIDPDGNKRFLTGGAKRGRFHMIGSPEGQPYRVIGYAEGYATASTLHEALNVPVIVTFDAGNILPVAKALKAVYPNSRHVFFADHDAYNGYPQAFIKQSQATPAMQAQIAHLRAVRPDVLVEVVADDDPRLRDKDKHYNTGVTAALLAAAVVDGDVVVPHFNNNGEGAA